MGFICKKSEAKMCIHVLHSVMMAWTRASTWKKAAKWKRLIKQVQRHIIIQRNRRQSIMNQSSSVIAQLLQNHQLQKAFDMVKQLYKDKCRLAAYDQMEHFCVCISTNLPLLIYSSSSTLEGLPSGVTEAVSSLVFAASRCGEFPELNLLRNLLRKRFEEVAKAELFNESLVSPKMKQNLCIGSIPDDVKLKLIKEIAEEHNLHLGFQDFEQKTSPQCPTHTRFTGLSDEKCNEQEAGVLTNMEMQDSFSDNYDNLIQTSQHKASEKMDSKGLISNNNDFEAIPGNQVEKNGVQMEKQEGFSSALSSTWKPVLPEDHRYHIYKLEKQRGDSFCSGYVHPKLPDYEDVLAKLTELKSLDKPFR